MHFCVAYVKKRKQNQTKIVYSPKKSNIPKTSLLEIIIGIPFRAGIRPLISPVPINLVSQKGQADSQLLWGTVLVQLAKVVVGDLNDH